MCEGGEEREGFIETTIFRGASVVSKSYVLGSLLPPHSNDWRSGMISSHSSTIFESGTIFKEHLVKTWLCEGNAPKINIQVQITHNLERGFLVHTDIQM